MQTTRFAGLLALLTCATVAMAGMDVEAGDVYFIQRRTPPLVKSGAPSKSGRRPVLKRQGGREVVDAICCASSDGRSTKRLFESRWLIRSVSVTADGARVLCHLMDSSNSSRPESQLLLMDGNGKVKKTISLAALDLRVYGTPVLLPDQTRIGMTVCKLTDRALLHGAPAPQRPNSKHGQVDVAQENEQLSDRLAAREQWAAGTFPSPPFIAAIDLEGKNLEEIGPGAMATWSPDGKTILYTDLEMPNPVAGPVGCRLSMMDADGHNSRVIVPSQACDGAFSRDGKKIAFIRLAEGQNSEVFVCDGSGANSRKISGEATIFASPRWLPDGSSVEVTRQLHIEPAGRGWREPDCVWVFRADGPPPRQVSRKGSDVLSVSLIDDDVRTLLTRLVRLPSESAGGKDAAGNTPGDASTKEATKIQAVPTGCTVQFMGTKVFLRDAEGRRTPMPDGRWRLPNGIVINVEGGRKVAH
jgi:WD40-like Beta Propeller Repeat